MRRTAWLLLTTVLAWATLLGTPAVSSPAGAEELRTVTLRVAADETYRAQEDWEATIRSAVGTVSDIYARRFKIRFVIREIVPWTLGEVGPVREILKRLRAEVPGGDDVDVVVAFTRGRCVPLEYGAALPFDRFAVILTGCPGPNSPGLVPTEVILSHEMGHLFGAFHVRAGAPTVMRGGPADRFDNQSSRVIALMRGFDFRRGVLGLDEPTRRAWSAVYAEGHEPGGPNPLAAKIAIAAMEAFRAGRAADAEAALRVALDLAPTDAVVRANLGLLHHARGQLEDAVRELAEARALNPGLVEARTELGFALYDLHRDNEAFSEFRAAVTQDPRFAPARVGLAEVLARGQRLPDAINQLQEAARLEPHNGNTQYGLAVLLYRAGYYDESRQAVQRAQSLGQQIPLDFIQSLEQKAPSH
jgi:Flp pilus assembly protein TadD